MPRGLEHKPAYLEVIAASAKRAAVAGRDAGLTAFPLWAGRERSDRAGINPAEGRPLFSDTDVTSVIDKIMVWSGDFIFTQRHAIKNLGERSWLFLSWGNSIKQNAL